MSNYIKISDCLFNLDKVECISYDDDHIEVACISGNIYEVGGDKELFTKVIRHLLRRDIIIKYPGK